MEVYLKFFASFKLLFLQCYFNSHLRNLLLSRVQFLLLHREGWMDGWVDRCKEIDRHMSFCHPMFDKINRRLKLISFNHLWQGFLLFPLR